jgi:hypothetical protein
VLTKAGLLLHVEPQATDVWSVSTFGYSGLHHLRRCAAHLHYAGKLPPPLAEGESPADDEYLVRYGIAFEQENSGAPIGALAAESDRPYDHLIMHSDAEGYYLPQRFAQVLIAGDQAFGWVGSSYALADECERLAVALKLPRELLTSSEHSAFNAALKPKEGGLFKPKPEAEPSLWRAHPIAALLCAKLYCAATHSIRTGAAVVFC